MSRPVLAFSGIALGLGWPVLGWPLLADRGLIPPAPPTPVLVLVVTYGVLVPAALLLTWRSTGGAGVRLLLGRVVRWRFGLRWWVLVVGAIPALSIVLALPLGGQLRVHAAVDALAGDLLTIVGALLAIHLAEELVWAGFVQEQLADRFGTFRGGLLTALPFAGIHLPLVLAGSTSRTDAAAAVLGLLLLAILLRTVIGLVLPEVAGSVAAVAVLHASFNAANNTGSLVDHAVDHVVGGIDHGLTAVLALAVVVFGLAARRLVRGRLLTHHPLPRGSS